MLRQEMRALRHSHEQHERDKKDIQNMCASIQQTMHCMMEMFTQLFGASKASQQQQQQQQQQQILVSNSRLHAF